MPCALPPPPLFPPLLQPELPEIPSECEPYDSVSQPFLDQLNEGGRYASRICCIYRPGTLCRHSYGTDCRGAGRQIRQGSGRRRQDQRNHNPPAIRQILRRRRLGSSSRSGKQAAEHGPEEFTTQGLTGINAYDGAVGWKIDPWGGKKGS